MNNLTQEEARTLNYDWEFWSRPAQRLPSGNWTNWLILTGRGWGKTRTGAESVRLWVKDYPMVNLIGATADDARDIMIEGESGILNVCPPDEKPEYKKNESKLVWPNGAVSLVFTAIEPERLRGKQHMKLWCDEMAAWRYPETAWDQASLGLRLGNKPQCIITTTPKPIKLVKDILRSQNTIVTTGTTYENRSNLAADFYNKIITKFEGTRLGRQELAGEVLDSYEGMVYDAFDAETCVIKRFAIPPDWPRYTCHDFGRNNTACLWYAQEPSTGFFYMYRSYLGGNTVQNIVDDWVELSKDEPIRRRVGGNHQEEQTREAFRMAGWPIVEPSVRNIETQVMLVNEMHKKNLIYVFSDQYDYLEQKSTYLWDVDREGNYTGKIHNESQFHYMACERYGMSEFKAGIRYVDTPHVSNSGYRFGGNRKDLSIREILNGSIR